jgi:preprotein translocase subunit SecA
MEILYSLGCSCTWKYGKRAGNKTAKHDQFVIRINVPNEIKYKFFRLGRKKDIAEKAKNYKKRKDYSKIAIVDIKKLEEQTEQVCFEVDNDEHLFLVDKYVVTHNTLVATAPAYLNALTGKGVHVVTVNDYLAKRDMEQMRKVYNFLGLSVGCILQEMNPDEKQKAYLADITYGTNNEFGFDYLRDNMVKSKTNVNQRELNYAIIDEIDSILIDEARTPLIISGQGTDNMALFKYVDIFVKSLERGPDIEEKTKLEMLSNELDGVEEEVVGDFLVDERHHSVILTKHGVKKAEEWFKIDNLSATENLGLSGYITQSLKANYIMKRDKDYLVKDDKIAIIDDFTGRLMENRRYSDGLHQAIEAKEGVKINKESKTQATTTLQNYFRMYNKISGMTGTAKTEETEFNDIYKLKVVTIPTNRPIKRIDENDKIYITMNKKYEAIIEKVKEIHAKGQPVLIGTESVDKSEKLSKLLKKAGIPHNVLNAKQHEAEAMIIAQAGRLNAVTIATNMAGRGTDILLGGNPEFITKKEMFEEGYDPDVIEIACGFMKITMPELIEARKIYQEKLAKNKIITDKEKEDVVKTGGLYIIGTDRHESRRIDNQLRGRAGRQGDPGNSCFYLSLEDDLIRLFGGEQLKSVISMTEKDDDVYIDSKILSKLVESSQKKIEVSHYDSRKSTLEYDDVNNIQRNEIYSLRKEILFSDDNYDLIIKLIKDSAKLIVDKYSENSKKLSVEQLDNILTFVNSMYESDDEIILTSLKAKDLYTELSDILIKIYEEKIKFIKEELNENPEKLNKIALLSIIDKYWISYISAMINLKDYVSVAGYGSLKPIQLYKLQALEMFNNLLDNIKIDVVKILINFKEQKPEEKVQNVVINLDNKKEVENKILNENIDKPTSSVVKKPYIARNPALERRNQQISNEKSNNIVKLKD